MLCLLYGNRMFYMPYNETPTKEGTMSDLNPVHLAVYSLLKLSANTMYVTPDGLHLYILMTQDDEEGLLDIEWIANMTDGRRFSEMNGDELNEFLTDFLPTLFEE